MAQQIYNTMSIYKTEAAKTEIMRLYDAKLASLNLPFEDLYVDTFAGKTHIVALGDAQLPPLVVLHGINAGAPLALEAIKDLSSKYRIYGIDTVGQATKSSEQRLPFKGDDYGKWLVETMDALHLDKVPIIAISFGAFLLHKLMSYQPQRIGKAIFVVPSGFVGGKFWRSMRELTFPLMKFLWGKKEADLLRFMDAFFIEKDPHSVAFQKAVLLGLKMDYRRPPLLQPKDVKGVEAPVYTMVADDDVFFPGEATLARCKVLFRNFKESYVLKGCKHIPAQGRYSEISAKIAEWLQL